MIVPNFYFVWCLITSELFKRLAILEDSTYGWETIFIDVYGIEWVLDWILFLRCTNKLFLMTCLGSCFNLTHCLLSDIHFLKKKEKNGIHLFITFKRIHFTIIHNNLSY